ncbi:MAG TPA: hypothetical protein VMT00_11840 [Thermoanaerobaculia bacterium]|nr:hypothetical protein [Thermoanaerobaculia bacterium]
MSDLVPPRPYPEWRTTPADREEDAAYVFGYHLIQHCRDKALKTIKPEVSAELREAVREAVDTALHNVNDMLEGYWRLDAGPDHTVELVLCIRVHGPDCAPVETIEISPCKLDLPIGYWKWVNDRAFR